MLTNDPAFGTIDAFCVPEVASTLVAKLLEQIPLQKPHYMFLHSAISEFAQFRRVIRQLITERPEAKERMLDWLGADYLLFLEILHPDILHIGEFKMCL
jgi:hypothetical protein